MQDWHDDYHVRHGENGLTRDVQRAILAEVLHEKICRKGIRMLLNCRVSNSRFKEVKIIMKEHGGSYRIFRKRSNNVQPATAPENLVSEDVRPADADVH